jgi:hypothetical protein
MMVLLLRKNSVPDRSLFPAKYGYGEKDIGEQPGFDFL